MSELLTVRDLAKHYPGRGGWLGREGGTVRAVDGVSFAVGNGETLGLVGESGCGKTTVGRSVLRLIEPTSGEIRFDGTDVMAQEGENLRRLRRDMQIVFQDPFSSLNPRQIVEDIVGEPLRAFGSASAAERRVEVERILELVGLRPEHRLRFPHEFSGGQRQRIGIARALVSNPRFVVADEATSALDVSVQAQILNLLADIQARLGLAMLFISHDLAVVRYVCRRVAVMYLGRIVETGPVDEVIRAPLHPYAQLLTSSAPVHDPSRRRRRRASTGEPPSPLNPPSGCRFHTRCPHRTPICETQDPGLAEVAPGRQVACWLHAKDAPPALSEAASRPTADQAAANVS